MENFHHELLRKYTIVFGTLFDKIDITRKSDPNTDDHSFRVPMSYGPKEKFLARLNQDPAADRKDAIRLPRMSFNMVDMQYNGIRKRNRLNKIVNDRDVNGNNALKRMWEPVPYDIIFELNIIGKNIEDVSKVIEQIIPSFQPEWNVSVKLFDEFPNYIIDIPIELLSVVYSDDYDADFSTRRAVICTMTFNMKVSFYGPVREQGVIKISKVNVYSGMDSTHQYEQVKVTPGLDEDGNPTPIPFGGSFANTANGTFNPKPSIHWDLIDEDDPWQYVVEIESYPEDLT